jgi:hypothetical protein
MRRRSSVASIARLVGDRCSHSEEACLLGVGLVERSRGIMSGAVMNRYLSAALNDLASIVEEREVLQEEFAHEIAHLREEVTQGRGAFRLVHLAARLGAHPLGDAERAAAIMAALTLRRLPEEGLLKRALLALRRGVLQMRQQEGVTAGAIWSESHELSNVYAVLDALYGEPPLPPSAVEIEARLRLLAEDLMAVAASDHVDTFLRQEAASCAMLLVHILNRRS